MARKDLELLLLCIGVAVQLAQFFGDLLQGFDLLFRQAVGGDVGRVADAKQVIAGDAKD